MFPMFDDVLQEADVECSSASAFGFLALIYGPQEMREGVVRLQSGHVTKALFVF
jgi:hypothetical protein